ncbi:MAG: hypothetical protein KGI28_00615 [Thaumarchaeota archaeon]|nr:hypothetical protein [Nitrososphaerota archaeon]
MPRHDTFMNKIIPGIILVILFSSLAIGLHQAFAYGQFLQMPIRVTHSPTICAIEPQPDTKFPTLGKQLSDETEYAVMDWKNKLNDGLGKHPVWNINLIKVPVNQQRGFNYTKCDITIHYLPQPEKTSNGFIATGVTIPNFETGKTNIEIYYLDIQPNWEQVEWTQNNQMYYIYVDKPYYTGLVATTTQLDSTIRHEIGHSLGLGHYIVPNGELQDIINGMEDMPSIMIDTVTVLGVKHFDITLLDVAQIKSIYGNGGFDNQVMPKFGYQRVHQLSLDKQSFLPDESITLHTNTDSFSDKSFAEILVVDADNHLIGNFGISKLNSTIPLNYPYENNKKYWVELLNPITGDFDYAGFTIGKQSLQVSLPVQTTQTPIQIPNWVKTNAGWWAKGSVTDNDFISAIQYMIKQGIMHVPSTQSSTAHSSYIPKWIKTNAGLWANGTISDSDFIKTLQYLINNGIIQI